MELYRNTDYLSISLSKRLTQQSCNWIPQLPELLIDPPRSVLVGMILQKS